MAKPHRRARIAPQKKAVTRVNHAKVDAATAMAVVMTAVVNAPKVRLLKALRQKTGLSTLKLPHYCQLTASRKPAQLVNKVKSNASRVNAAAVTVMAATAVNVARAASVVRHQPVMVFRPPTLNCVKRPSL